MSQHIKCKQLSQCATMAFPHFLMLCTVLKRFELQLKCVKCKSWVISLLHDPPHVLTRHMLHALLQGEAHHCVRRYAQHLWQLWGFAANMQSTSQQPTAIAASQVTPSRRFLSSATRRYDQPRRTVRLTQHCTRLKLGLLLCS